MASRPRLPSWLRNLAAQPLRQRCWTGGEASRRPSRSCSTRRSILVALRRHRRARRYTLRIHAGTREVILTMPPRGSVREAKAFAQKHGGWIAARLRRLPDAAPFTDGATMPLRGVEHRIVHRPRPARHGLDSKRATTASR